MFEKLYLDPIYRLSLERIAIQEGFVEETDDNIVARLDALATTRNPLKSRTLQLLTLFEEVDPIQEIINLDCLSEIGLIVPKKNSKILGEKINLLQYDRVSEPAEYITTFLLTRFKQHWIRSYLKKIGQDCYDTSSLRTLQKHFDACVNLARRSAYIVDSDIKEAKDIRYKYGYYRFYRDVEEFYWGIAAGLKGSMMEGVQYASSVASSSLIPARHNFHAVEDMMYIAQAMLNDKIRVLPNPRNLKEAAKLKYHKHMKRFRDVITEWVDAIQEGRIEGEKRIRNDIALANRDLKHLQSWREFKSSPLAFWINAIGGHIPIFSNVLTFISTIGDAAYTKWVEKKSGWAMILN